MIAQPWASLLTDVMHAAKLLFPKFTAVTFYLHLCIMSTSISECSRCSSPLELELGNLGWQGGSLLMQYIETFWMPGLLSAHTSEFWLSALLVDNLHHGHSGRQSMLSYLRVFRTGLVSLQSLGSPWNARWHWPQSEKPHCTGSWHASWRWGPQLASRIPNRGISLLLLCSLLLLASSFSILKGLSSEI